MCKHDVYSFAYLWWHVRAYHKLNFGVDIHISSMYIVVCALILSQKGQEIGFVSCKMVLCVTARTGWNVLKGNLLLHCRHDYLHWLYVLLRDLLAAGNAIHYISVVYTCVMPNIHTQHMLSGVWDGAWYWKCLVSTSSCIPMWDTVTAFVLKSYQL